MTDQTSPVTETLAEIIGRHLATVVSGNNQPHMSGDPRNRLLGLRRRQFDDACQSAAEAVIAALGHAQTPAVQKADYWIGYWLSGALEDPAVCDQMKADIKAWFEAHQPGLDLALSDTSTEGNSK